MKKRVLYVDPISYGHHAPYNINNIKILSKICDLSVCVRNNYLDLDGIKTENVFLIDNNHFPNKIKRKNKIQYVYRYVTGQLSILRTIKRILKEQKFDLIIFSCVDIISFSLSMRRNKDKIVFIDHFLYMTQKYKHLSFFWKHLNKNIVIGTLEKYFENYIRNNLNSKNDICLVRHPFYKFEQKTVSSSTFSNKIVVFGPSNSNDMSFIKSIFENKHLIPDEFLIYVKGDLDYSDNKLTIYSNSLDRDLYDSLMVKSKYILIPYDETYNYRTSGVLFDAVSSNKVVLLKQGNTLSEYSKKCPNAILLFSDFKDLKDLLICNKNIDNEILKKEFDSLTSEHDESTIKRDFEKMLEKYS